MIIEIRLDNEKLHETILGLPYNSHKQIMILIPESDYGFAEIYRIHETILVFLIPQYGGTPELIYSIKDHSIEWMIEALRDIN